MKTKHGLAVLLVTVLAACGDNTSAAAGSAPVSEPAEAPATTATATTTAFELRVSDVFTITGKGLVATGQVKRGTISIGDEVCTASGKRTTVEGIEMFRKTLETLNAGDMGGLLLKGLSKADINKGDLITRC